ncbi:MAG: alpha-amylase/4-alpha-glucanotransferase domain-containing protein, partial [Methylophilaceae bacterium]|nr:alpha-amylase/4-alpha-glucanotransferase domain-containing protein [Methylophilaceae bacterium]
KNSLDFAASLKGGKINKKISLNKDTLIVQYSFSKLPQGSFKVEINLAMPSCDGPAGRFRIGENIPCGFGQPLTFAGLKDISLEDDVLGGVVHLTSSHACAFSSYPHFSVSQSEAGFEKIMQAVTLHLEWPSDTLVEDLQISIRVV